MLPFCRSASLLNRTSDARLSNTETILEEMGLRGPNSSASFLDASQLSLSALVDSACSCMGRSAPLQEFYMQERERASAFDLAAVRSALPFAAVLDASTRRLWDEPLILRPVLEQQRRWREQAVPASRPCDRRAPPPRRSPTP